MNEPPSMTTIETHEARNAAAMQKLLEEIMPQRSRDELGQDWDTDFAYAIENVARFRANCFMDRSGPGAVFRQIPFEILPVEELPSGASPGVMEMRIESVRSISTSTITWMPSESCAKLTRLSFFRTCSFSLEAAS